MQNRLPPRNAADFLELAENCTFLDRKLTNALNKTVDGHELGINMSQLARQRGLSVTVLSQSVERSKRVATVDNFSPEDVIL